MDVEPHFDLEPSPASVDLYWIPLGAGGAGFVRFNGRVYEAIKARLERRRPLDLYHTALEVRVAAGRFTIENAWPSPDTDTRSRGVVIEGPVGGRWIARFRPFRYEVRCWRDGIIPDAGEAAEGPQLLSDDPLRAQRLLDLVASVPPLTWGRDELRSGEMWNSNSVISWLLARSGLPVNEIRPPAGGRAPGWEAGKVAADLHALAEERTRGSNGETESKDLPAGSCGWVAAENHENRAGQSAADGSGRHGAGGFDGAYGLAGRRTSSGR